MVPLLFTVGHPTTSWEKQRICVGPKGNKDSFLFRSPIIRKSNDGKEYAYGHQSVVRVCGARAYREDADERELLETLRNVLSTVENSDVDITDEDERMYESSAVDVNDERAFVDGFMAANRQRGLPSGRPGKRGWGDWFKGAIEDAGDWFEGAGNSIADFFDGAFSAIAKEVNKWGDALKNLPGDLRQKLPELKNIYNGLNEQISKLYKEVEKQSGKAKEGAQKLLDLAKAEKDKAWNEIEKSVQALCPPNELGSTCSQDSNCNCSYLKCMGWWSKRCRVSVTSLG
ncbi:hypothetical protein MAR_036523 [Mya arenaria]|uniref:Uncharacterized protein n=1 Tax=Mya arenaria TaxID=6604 RepID=A0ABY7FNZ0_MYAAR|nr:hypothetical protein MAR_036523 [Mya arenaria]